MFFKKNKAKPKAGKTCDKNCKDCKDSKDCKDCKECSKTSKPAA